MNKELTTGQVFAGKNYQWTLSLAKVFREV